MADPRQAQSQPSNRMCQMCNARSPSFYCMCTGSQLFICPGCVEQHYNKTPNLPHALMPAQMEIDGFNAYQERLSRLGAGKAELEANLANIDQSCQELSEVVNSIIASLTQYRDYWVGQLQAWKNVLAGDVTQSIAEVQASLAEKEVHLTGKYSMSLRNYQPGDLVLFNYRIDPGSIASGLESLFKTEYPPPKVLPSQVSHPEKVQSVLVSIESTKMKLFNFERQQWQQPIALRTTIDVNSRYTFLDDDRLFCCGGRGGFPAQAIGETYLISAGGEVQPLGLMITARCNHGLIFLPRNVYVFGGWDGNELEKSEMFSVTGPLPGEWKPLPDMSQPRADFNPCLINGLVFLCGSGSTLMEIFDPATNTFYSSVTLPEAEPSVLLEEAGTLVVISRNYFTKYLVQGTTLQQHSQQQHAYHGAVSASLPVMYDRMVYLSWNGSCRIVDKNSGDQISEIK